MANSDIIIAPGTVLSCPFELELLEQLKLEARYEKLPIISAEIRGLQGEESRIGARTYPQIWLTNYVLSNQGDTVTSREILRAGFPTSGRYKDSLTPVVKDLKKLKAAGMPVELIGGRTERRYALPLFQSVKVVYLGNRDKELGARRSCRVGTRANNDAAKARESKSIELPGDTTLVAAGETGWKVAAACKNAPAGLFFSEDDEQIGRAIEYCAHCSVRPECSAEQFLLQGTGVWGGQYYPTNEAE